VHLIHGDGNLHEGGPAHDNWPISITSVNFFPFVAEGVASPVVMADVNDDGRPDIAAAGTAGQTFIWDGIQPERPSGFDADHILILDANSRGPLSNVAGSSDRPLLNTFAAGSLGDLDQDGRVDFITGGAGLGLALNLGGGFANSPFEHQIGAWNTNSGAQLPGFPQSIEDYLFFVNPVIVNVDADPYPELVTGSAGYWVRAWDACGREAEGFPKFAGGWIISTVAAGDIDGDDLREIVVATRSGYMFAWNTDAPVDSPQPWPTYRHDNYNTGNADMPLSYGMPTMTEEPIDCPDPVRPDGGVDGGEGDAGADVGAEGDLGGGGCGCYVSSRDEKAPLSALLLALLLGGALFRRRRR
jgi:MYXO-CTERM domain-containing protein